MASEYIFTMHGVSRTHPPDKTVLSDISLSFFHGAKIGVLGLNGSGKSTLLRIMAGVDDGYRGEAQLKAGATVGLLEQEPQLDESKDVRGNVEDGVRELRDLVDRYNEVAANYSDDTADEFARLQDRIDAADAWNLDTMLDTAMDALRLPPADADVTKISGGERRRVALCRLLLSAPDLLLLDEPTNHLDAESVAWLERHLAAYAGAVVAVTHDRYFLDNVAGWILELDRGRGIPFKGNYSSWLEQKTERLAQEQRSDRARTRALAAELEWVRENPKGRRKKSKARLARYEALLAEDRNTKLEDVQIHIPAGPRLGDRVIEADGPAQGLRRAAAHRRALVLAAARRDRRRDRGQRRRQDHPLPDDRGRRGARRGQPRSRRVRAARLRRPVARRARRRTRPCGRRSPRATTRSRSATAR